MALTPKQALFCEEYLYDCNATQAAIRAGYSKKTAYSIGQANLKKPEIQERVQQLMKERSERVKITADMVLAELALIGFANMGDFVRLKEGKFTIDFDDIEEQNQKVVSEITVGTGDVIKLKLHDKLSALEKIAKHIDFYKADSSAEKGVNVSIYLPDNERD